MQEQVGCFALADPAPVHTYTLQATPSGVYFNSVYSKISSKALSSAQQSALELTYALMHDVPEPLEASQSCVHPGWQAESLEH